MLVCVRFVGAACDYCLLRRQVNTVATSPPQEEAVYDSSQRGLKTTPASQCNEHLSRGRSM
jgi:hypothetical protein